MAWPKDILGIMAKPSTRMMMTLHAITASPMLLVRVWTTSMATDMMAWVMPEGTPMRTIRRALSRRSRRESQVRSNTSRIRSSFSRHSTAEMPWASTVARPTPSTPIRNPATNQMSRAMFSPVATSRNSRADTESPSPRRMPERML